MELAFENPEIYIFAKRKWGGWIFAHWEVTPNAAYVQHHFIRKCNRACCTHAVIGSERLQIKKCKGACHRNKLCHVRPVPHRKHRVYRSCADNIDPGIQGWPGIWIFQKKIVLFLGKSFIMIPGAKGHRVDLAFVSATP